MENLLKDMGKRIFDRRKQLNMTQETLAELAHVTPQTISTAEPVSYTHLSYDVAGSRCFRYPIHVLWVSADLQCV